MAKKSYATQVFALYCFLLAVYLSVGGFLQSRWGLLGISFNEIFLLLLPGLLFAKILGLGIRDTFPLRKMIFREFLWVLLLTALVIAPIEVLIHLQEKVWPLPREVQTFYQDLVSRKTWVEGVWQFFVLALIPAVCEELFFRGLLQGLFVPRFGIWGGIFLTSAFFAVAHFNPWYLPYYFLLGLYFGWLRQWRNNLSLCIFAHFLNNLYSLYG